MFLPLNLTSKSWRETVTVFLRLSLYFQSNCFESGRKERIELSNTSLAFGLVKQILPCLLLNHLSWDIHIHNIYVQTVYLYMYVAHINREYFSIVKYYHNPLHTIFPILLYVRFTTYSRFAGYCLDIWLYNIQHLNFNHTTWYHIFGTHIRYHLDLYDNPWYECITQIVHTFPQRW